ncbi:MAG: ABC-2 family transporter protein [Nanoarchaeota archaeon]|nr:ABC-2 family transporter protein [Nanoarchaeota archaeon]
MNLRVVFETFKIALKDRMAYRTDFIADVLIGPLIFLVVQFLWTNIYTYNNITEINGFTLNDSISYLAVSTIVGYFVWTWVTTTVGMKIKRGDFARYVIMPINFLDYTLVELFGRKVPSMLIKAPLLFLLLKIFFNVHVADLPHFILFIGSMVFSYLLFNIFMFIMGLLTFWQESFWVFNMLGSAIIEFFSGWLLPIDFYPSFMKPIIEILPFRHIYYSPIMIFLEKYSISSSIQVLVSQFFSVIILYLLARLILRLGRAKFTSQGG